MGDIKTKKLVFIIGVISLVVIIAAVTGLIVTGTPAYKLNKEFNAIFEGTLSAGKASEKATYSVGGKYGSEILVKMATELTPELSVDDEDYLTMKELGVNLAKYLSARYYLDRLELIIKFASDRPEYEAEIMADYDSSSYTCKIQTPGNEYKYTQTEDGQTIFWVNGEIQPDDD